MLFLLFVCSTRDLRIQLAASPKNSLCRVGDSLLQLAALCTDPFSFVFMPPPFRRVSALEYAAVAVRAKEC